jgi:UDPglucose 6-dehydrogenase
MKKKKNIAVIGQGFVGGSLTTVFAERGFDVFTYDKLGKRAPGGQPAYRPNPDQLRTYQHEANSVADLIAGCELDSNFTGVFFVCVPTPMYDDGSADLSIVESVLVEIAEAEGKPALPRVAVIKSTVPPGSTMKWNEKFNKKGLFIVFNPEFLTERTALEDMRNQNRIVLGGPRPHINRVKQLFQTAFAGVPLIKTSSTTAECVKYMTNCFLATKVTFANEMSQVCEALDRAGYDIDYDKVVEYATRDIRMGESHWAVPGPDGSHGFGGHCFPKDLNAFTFLARSLGIKPTVMEAVWKKNLEVREDRDWEKMTGRAVSSKKSNKS